MFNINFTNVRKRFQTLLTGILALVLIFLSGFEDAVSQNSVDTEYDDIMVQLQQDRQRVSNNVNLITVQISNLTIAEALEKIAEQIKVGFSYNPDIIPDKTVSLDMIHTPAYRVIYKVLEGTNLEPVLPPSKDVIVIREKGQPAEEEIFQDTVSGTVVDAETGEHLPGVNILIQGTSTGTSTDVDGNFNLSVPDLDAILIITYIGYQRLEIPIDGREELIIELTPDIITGDDVVVVGYGVQRRSDVTGSVSSIDRRAITDEPVYSMENALQGHAAGVQVVTDGYRPGEGATIRIRGTRSFEAGNDPLFVIDGIPVDAGLQDINPRDVESIEILKDASATAIYGSRGANGVVLVTTRRGTDGLSIDYSGFTGVQYTFDRLNMMDTPTYAEFVRNAHINEGTYTGNDEDIFEDYLLEALAEGRTTDWQDLVFQRGLQQNHTLSVRGGSNGTLYSISGSFDDHKATVLNNDFRRISGRVNLDQEISSRIQMGVSANVNNSIRHESVSIRRVIGNFPMTTPYDSNGNLVMYDQRDARNPLFDMQRENSLDQTKSTRIIGTAYLELDLIPENLMLRANFSPDFRFQSRGEYYRDIPNSTAGVRDLRQTNLLYEAILDYRNNFRGVHALNVTSMYSVENNEQNTFRLEVEDLPYEHQLFHDLESAGNVLQRSSGLSEWTLESYMMRGNYVYDNRYLLTLTGRVDGSSRFADGNKYGVFPSMAIAWHIGNESFMQDFDILSELKLRFSVGETGNTGIRPYQTQGTLRPVPVLFVGQDTHFAFEHGDIPNPDLKWERTRSMDLGIDFAFLQDRIRGTIDLYQSDTKDLLMLRQLPQTSGFTSTLENVGSTRNRGIEISLSSINIHTSNFLWSTNLNFSANRNEIVELFGGKEDDPGSGWFIGESINSHYYWEMIGVWQLDEAEQAAAQGKQPGDRKFRDVTGDGQITDEDRVILGNSDPKWTAGWSNRINYRAFDFSFMVYAAYGMIEETFITSNHFQSVLSMRADPLYTNNLDVPYWTPDNPTNEFYRARLGSPARLSAQSFQDVSFVRIRNITLGYSIPNDFLERFGARNSRIYVSVQNPLTITRSSFIGYDPEGAHGEDMPNYTTFLLGIDLGF